MGLELAIVNDERYQWRSQPDDSVPLCKFATNSYPEPLRCSKALVWYGIAMFITINTINF